MQDGEFKYCPYCKEQIRASAIKCRYCGEWLEEQPESNVAQPIEERVDAKATELAAASSAPQLPPDDKLTNDAEPDGDPSSPPAAQGEPTAAAPAEPTPPKRSNYFLRHWRGELSLGVSYWANGFLANLFLVVVVGAGAALQETASLKTVAVLCIFIFALSLALSFWQIVGTWRAASNHVQRGGLKVWATLAQIALLLGTLRVVSVVVTSIFPQTVEYWSILCGDKGIPAYTIQVISGGTELEFSGGIRAGSAQELKRALQASPEIKVLRMNSVGGRIHEAMKFARLVRERGLDTYTSQYCLSAATLVFIAGKQRVVAEGAKLGFHGGTFPGMTVEQLRASDEMVRQTMVTAGVARGFIDRALATPSRDMWYPSFDELRVAGVITNESDQEVARRMVANLTEVAEHAASGEAAKMKPIGNAVFDAALPALNALSQNISGYLSRMEDEIDALHCDDVFSASVLAKEPAIESEMSKRVESQKIIARYKQGFEPMIQTGLAKVTSVRASDETMRPATNAIVKKAVTTNASRYDEMFLLRLRREKTEASYLTFMHFVFGDYQFTEKKILFKTPTNAQEHNYLVARINDAIKDAEAYERRQLVEVEAAKTQIQKLVP